MVAALAGLATPWAARHLVRAAALFLLVVPQCGPGRACCPTRGSRDVGSTWVQALADRDPNDLIVSFAPTLTSHYLGRTDFWMRPTTTRSTSGPAAVRYATSTPAPSCCATSAT